MFRGLEKTFCIRVFYREEATLKGMKMIKNNKKLFILQKNS